MVRFGPRCHVLNSARLSIYSFMSPDNKRAFRQTLTWGLTRASPFPWGLHPGAAAPRRRRASGHPRHRGPASRPWSSPGAPVNPPQSRGPFGEHNVSIFWVRLGLIKLWRSNLLVFREVSGNPPGGGGVDRGMFLEGSTLDGTLIGLFPGGCRGLPKFVFSAPAAPDPPL